VGLHMGPLLQSVMCRIDGGWLNERRRRKVWRGWKAWGLRGGNLGRHRPLTLQFALIPIKRLLPAIFKVGTVMMLRQTV
jgi:hypothetical protein